MRPDDLQYTKDHEWVRMEEGAAIIGITDYAAQELGDIVYIELPEVGREVQAGESMGTIETVKAVEDVYAPLSGTVVEVNASLEQKPEAVNEDPYGEGWLVRIEPEGDAEDLMSAADYDAMIG
jgi:glycine cleavage system H protein